MTEETKDAPVETITIDNVVYNLTDLTEQEQTLIGIFKQWKNAEGALQNELESDKKVYIDAAREKQLELMKTQAALRQLSNEISLSVKKSQEDKTDQQTDPA